MLLATDAAGEGVNLQVAHLMVNYDIPWNPNRLEQRFGRIHRIGQRHTCHLWNLVAVDTREGDVFATLLEKLERQREALGDRVFDVLGDVLTDTSLTELLTEAIRSGTTDAAVRAAGDMLESGLREAVVARERSVSSLTEEDLIALRAKMDRATARSLQPVVVRDFVTSALARLHGDLRSAGPHWSVHHVPARVRQRDPGTVAARYDVVTFERVAYAPLQTVTPELISPGHPFLNALTSVVLDEHGALLQRGTVLVDDRSGDDYVLMSLRTAGEDARFLTLAVQGDEALTVDPAGFADLAYGRDPTADEVAMVRGVVERAPALVEDGAMSLQSCEVLAVALVRGTASRTLAEAWGKARASIASEVASRGTVTIAPRFVGWDLELETHAGVTFIRAEPQAVPVVVRRQERLAEANLGESYLVVRHGQPS